MVQGGVVTFPKYYRPFLVGRDLAIKQWKWNILGVVILGISFHALNSNTTVLKLLSVAHCAVSS